MVLLPVAILNSRVYQVAPAGRIAALPSASNLVRRRSLADTSNFQALVELDLATGSRAQNITILPKQDPNPR